MKILFWTEVFWPHIGGAEIFCFNLYQSLKARGHELILITDQNLPHLDETAEIAGLPVYRLPFRQGLTGKIKQLAYAKGRVEAIKNAFQPDLIHLHTFGPASIFHVESQAKCRRPTLMTLHVHPGFSLKKDSEFLSRLEKSIDGVAAVSKNVHQESQEYFTDPLVKQYCIMNAIPVPAMPLETTAKNRDPYILSLGRMVAEKGFRTALQAFTTLVPTHPNLRYVIAGDGPDLDSLKAEAARLSILPRVEFRGWVAPQDTNALMAGSSMVLIPSEWEEPFGLVALEAAHLAIPVVATRSGGLSEIVMDQESGVLVAKQNPEAMAAAIQKLLQDPKGAQQMGQRAQARARKVFCFETMVDRYEAAYQDILTDSPKDRAR